MAGPYLELDFLTRTSDTDGCPFKDALAKVPIKEHLAAIREMEQHFPVNTHLQVHITPGSDSTNFEFALTTGAPPSTEIAQMAEKFHMPVAEMQQLADHARGWSKPVLLLYEKAQDGYVTDIQCFGQRKAPG